MTMTTSSNNVNIIGNIKSVSDYQEIKSQVDTLVEVHKSIIINIKDSLSITSSVIGYFNKLVLKDSIGIEMRVGNEQLMELLDDLNLAALFKAKKV